MIEIKNKKAYFDYTILESIEAGISLVGTEIKSIRKGKPDTTSFPFLFKIINKQNNSIYN